ncbi:MAG: SagB/ThcOx family dehydrogenase [Desulfonatronovibrio sp.]
MFTRSVMIIIGGFIFLTFYQGGIMNHGTARAGQEISLPEPVTDGEKSVEKAIAQRRSVRGYSGEALALNQVSQILWAAQGISDTRGRFRTAPSAGATYPLEIFLASGRVNGLESGVFRYKPQNHSLDRIMDSDQRDALYAQALQQSAVKDAPAVIIIGGIFERTTGKYGARGERYVYMEAGHAGQNIYLQATSLGLGTVAIGAFDDSGVRKALSLPAEVTPFYLMPLGK